MTFLLWLKRTFYQTRRKLINPVLTIIQPTKYGCGIKVTDGLPLPELSMSIYPGNFQHHVHRRSIDIDCDGRHVKVGCAASIILHKPKVRVVEIEGIELSRIAFTAHVIDKFGCTIITWWVEMESTSAVTADELNWYVECDHPLSAGVLISSPGGIERVTYLSPERIDP